MTRPLALAFALALSAFAADQKAVDAAAAKVAARDRVIQQLQNDLHQARADADARAAATRSGLEAVNRSVEARAESAQASAAAERARAEDARAQLERMQGVLQTAQTQLAEASRDKTAVATELARLTASQKQTARAAEAQTVKVADVAAVTVETARQAQADSVQAFASATKKLEAHDQVAFVQAEATLMAAESARLATYQSIGVSLIGFFTVVIGLWFKDRKDRRIHRATVERLAENKLSTDAVASKVVTLRDDLGGVFPELRDPASPRVRASGGSL